MRSAIARTALYASHPARVVLLGTAATALLLGLLGWATWAAYRAEIRERELTQLQTALQVVTATDEAMTRAVRLAAAMGERDWPARHARLAAQMEGGIRRVRELAPLAGAAAAAARLDEANLRITRAERAALALVQAGQRDQALALISTAEYNAETVRFTTTLAELSEAAAAEIRRQHEAVARRLRGGGLVAGLGALGLLLVWRLVLVRLRHYVRERDRAEAALHESERRLSTLIASLPGCVYRTRNEPTWPFEFVSEGVRELTGYPPSVFMEGELEYGEVIHPADREPVWDAVQRALERGEPYRLEYRIRTREGEERWVWEQGQGVFSAAGELQALEGFLTDFTERRQAETRKRQLIEERTARAHAEAAERTIRGILESLTSAFWALDREWRTAYLNRAAVEVVARLTGRTPAEGAGASFWDTFPELLGTRTEHEIRRAVETQRPVHLEERFDRWGVWFEIHASPSADGLSLSFRDITERKRTEEALAEAARTNARFAAALDNLATGVLITDPRRPDNPIIYTNPGFLATTGYCEAEILGRNARFLQGADTDPDVVREVREAVAQRVPFRGRILNYRRDGTSFWNEMTISPVFDAAGELINFVGLQSDITGRVRTEEQVQRQLREKTVLLQEVHHRVKNNLQIVSSLLNMQIRTLRDPQATKALQDSRSRIQAIALAHETLYRSGNFARVDLGGYLRTLVQQLQRSQVVGRRVELKLDLEPQRCFVPLTQAVPCGLVMNELISNALKHAFPDDRPGEVRVALCPAGNRCTLIVSDDGLGLPDEIDLHAAPSVGLQLVDDLTHQLRGALEVRRQRGTEFRITFTPAEENA